MGVGDILQKLLDERNISINKLATDIEVSAQTLYSIVKRNNTKVSFEVLIKICNYLNVDVDTFYSNYKHLEIIKSNLVLTEEENKFILCFRNLNQEGKEKVISYVDDLVSSGNYRDSVEIGEVVGNSGLA